MITIIQCTSSRTIKESELITTHVTTAHKFIQHNATLTGLSRYSGQNRTSEDDRKHSKVIHTKILDYADYPSTQQQSSMLFASTTVKPMCHGEFFASWQGIFILAITSFCICVITLAAVFTRSRLKYIVQKKSVTYKKSMENIENETAYDENSEDFGSSNGQIEQNARPSLTWSEISSGFVDDLFESDQERRLSSDTSGISSLYQSEQTISSTAEQRKECTEKQARSLSSITELNGEET
ncbi:hypothetical protein SK128_009230 [Halocaridina rubra]|uniref:Uncharacterized protein n=1 Tax=Halocaridina rubra TaxID=373956 RepID=A0AAN9AFA2_HALRR